MNVGRPLPASAAQPVLKLASLPAEPAAGGPKAPAGACPAPAADTSGVHSTVDAALQSLEASQNSEAIIEALNCPTGEDYANGRGRPSTQSSSTEVG